MGGRITVESVVRCSWNGWPDDRGIRRMSVSDAKRLKELESENARLKKMLAESMLEIEVTREALRKKW